MEPLGHSFALGMDDSDVISGAIRVYERWLGVTATDGRPKCMQLQEQEFIRDLLGHMSLLFEDKEAHRGKPDLIAKHSQLCQTYVRSSCGRPFSTIPGSWTYSRSWDANAGLNSRLPRGTISFACCWASQIASSTAPNTRSRRRSAAKSFA